MKSLIKITAVLFTALLTFNTAQAGVLLDGYEGPSFSRCTLSVSGSTVTALLGIKSMKGLLACENTNGNAVYQHVHVPEIGGFAGIGICKARMDLTFGGVEANINLTPVFVEELLGLQMTATVINPVDFLENTTVSNHAGLSFMLDTANFGLDAAYGTVQFGRGCIIAASVTLGAVVATSEVMEMPMDEFQKQTW
jgi:hypothetical protein